MNGAIRHIIAIRKQIFLGAEALRRMRGLHLQHASVAFEENNLNMRRPLVWYHLTNVLEKGPEYECRISIRDVGSNVT
jgi:hypothetical protein